MKAVVCIFFVAVSISGCGATSSASSAATQPGEADVINALGADSIDGGVSYRFFAASQRCEFSVALNTPQEVSLYRDAGDTVVSNSSGSVGIKMSSAAPGDCLSGAAEKLERFK